MPTRYAVMMYYRDRPGTRPEHLSRRAGQGRGDLWVLSNNAIVHVYNDRRTNWPAAMYFVARSGDAHAQLVVRNEPWGQRIFKQPSFITLP